VCGDVRDWLSLEEKLSRRLDPPSEDVRVRGDPERAGEAANEMCGAGSEDLAGGGKRHSLGRLCFEEVTQPLGDLVDTAGIVLVALIGEVRPQSLCDECEVGLRLERLIGVTRRFVQNVEVTAQRSILDARLVDGATDQFLAQDARLQVDDALAVATTGRGAAVVNDVRWEHSDRRTPGAPTVPVEVVPDLTVVDDEDRPGVMRVRRVGMLVKLGVQHLADARHRRPPGLNLLRPGSA
jgi:hypothetical protein